MKDSLKKKMEGWPNASLTLGLLLVAAILVGVALYPGTHPIVKAVVLAWVILP